MNASSTAPHVMLLAGETSGDAHGAELVHHLKQLRDDIRISGMGSVEMKKAGVDVYYDSAGIAVMGIVEVLKHWGEIKRAMNLVKQQIETTRPDLLVLIDYPEFNLKMARHAKALGIRVLFYISPQVWAWRPKRIHKIGASIDHMAVLFRFETRYYEGANIPVTFVGHPLVDKVKTSDKVDQLRKTLGIPADNRVVGLFPGSRRSELARLMPVMLQTAAQMQQRNPNLSFVLPVAASLDRDAIQQQVEASGVAIQLTSGDIYDVIANCDAIVTCSGTVTLEIALLGVPMCVIYKLSWLSYQIMSRLVTIDDISLVNIVGDEHIVEELIQDDASADNIGRELFRLLDDHDHRARVEQGLVKVKRNLGEGNGSERMAQLVLSMLPEHVV